MKFSNYLAFKLQFILEKIRKQKREVILNQMKVNVKF